jgi:quinol monooxygenase YgiN
MTKLHLIARFKIKTGQIETFKKLVDQCIAIVNEKETGKGNLLYEWYLNEQLSECVVVETYVDSGALLTHMGNVGTSLGGIMQISDFSGELFGSPSTQLKEAISGLPITVFPYLAGAR